MANADQLLTRKQAAEMLGVSVPTLRRWEGNEKDRAAKITPVVDELGQHRFHSSDVRRMIRTGANKIQRRLPLTARMRKAIFDELSIMSKAHGRSVYSLMNIHDQELKKERLRRLRTSGNP